MRLKTVRLHPFGRFLDESWDISLPLAIVAGPNEIGKTTLRQAIFHVLFTTTNLTPAKLRDTMEVWFPLPGGDHAAVTMTFEHDGREWTLAKRWGVGKATQLSAVNVAPLADPQAVATKLADMLGHSEATFKHVLFTGHTELEQTIASLQKNSTEVRDIRDLLRAGGTGAGDVDEHRLRNVLDERIDKWFSRWDEERGRPQRQNGQEKGVNDKWRNGVGEILKKWYAWQDKIAERNELLRIETDIDHNTGELAKLDAQDRLDHELIDVHGDLRGQLSDRLVLEERVPRLEKELKELQEAFTECPKAAAAIHAWENQKPELEERAISLKSERDTASRREGAAAIVRSYEFLVKAQQELNDADTAVQQQSHPDTSTLAEINRLAETIHSAESKLAARTLAWRVEVAEPKTICVTSGFEPAEKIEVGHGGTKGTAAGRVQVEMGGIKLTVDGGDDDVDAILNNLQLNRESLTAILASCGAETVTAARELASAHTKLVDDADSKRRTFEGLLQGKLFEQWKREAEEVIALPQTRDLQSINQEIETTERNVGKRDLEAKAHEANCEKWKSRYGDPESLAELLLIKKSEFRKESDKLASAPTVPPGFNSAQNLITELEAAQKRLNASRQPRENIRNELNRLEVELGDRRSEDLAESAEVSERDFKRALTTGQCLKRIRETLNRVTAGGDDVLKDFAERVGQIFSQVTRDEAKLAFNGSLPAHVQRGVVKLEPKRLSQGASGAIALAIRLAMAEAYLKETGGFIMFDDPLVHFDINRSAEAADIIRAFAERHQVIFFTCHDHQVAQLKT